MPGIAGIYLNNNGEAKKYCNLMLHELDHQKNGSIDLHNDVDQGFCSGIIQHDFAPLKNQPFISKDLESCVLVDGEFYPAKDTNRICNDFVNYMSRQGFEGLNNISGIFSAVGFNKRKKQIRLVSDKFGLKPLYYSKIPSGFAFASEIKALLKVEGISKEINPQAFSDFFHFGFTFGIKTLFNNIHLLTPGTALIFDIESNSFAKEQYFKLESLFASNGEYDTDISLNDVADTFIQAVENRIDDVSQMGISLSGGLDSRAILAAMQDKANGISSYTLGLSGCHDEKLADQMSKIAGTDHTMLELGAEYLDDFKSMAQTLIYFSDGLYHPHESTEKLALDYFKKASFKYLFRGHGGEIAKASLAYPIQVDRSVKSITKMEGVLSFIGNSANLVSRDLEFKNLFRPEFLSSMNKGWNKSLHDTADDIDIDLAPEDLCIYFYIQEWVRRQVVSSLSIFRSRVEIRLPYLDEYFLSALLKMPVEQRYSGEVQKKIVENCMPKLTRISDSNTGAPLDASKFRLFLTDKFNSAMRRISLPGFRHYTEYEKWQRNQFKEGIEKIIFDERTLDRNIYNPDGLKNAFDNHMSGKKNYAHLLGTVSGLELWFRMFVD